MNEIESWRPGEAKVCETPISVHHLKHSFQPRRGCILTAQTCFPVENIHLISRHFPKRMCLSQSLCLPRTFVEKVPPSPKHQSLCSADLFSLNYFHWRRTAGQTGNQPQRARWFPFVKKVLVVEGPFLGNGGLGVWNLCPFSIRVFKTLFLLSA